MPPRPCQAPFHEANGGNEGIEHAGVMSAASATAEAIVELLRVAPNKFLRKIDPDAAQIAGD